MTRSVKITAWCDGRYPAGAQSAFYLKGELKRCTKTLDAPSHRKLTEKLERCGWIELQDGIVKCKECLGRELRGEPVQFSKRPKPKED